MNLLHPKKRDGNFCKATKTLKNSFNPFTVSHSLHSLSVSRHVWPKKKLLNKQQRQELKRFQRPNDGQLQGNEKEIFWNHSTLSIVVFFPLKISQIIYGFSCKNVPNFSSHPEINRKVCRVRRARSCCIEFLVNFTLFLLALISLEQKPHNSFNASIIERKQAWNSHRIYLGNWSIYRNYAVTLVVFSWIFYKA
jgi:hypothetical protein